MGLARVGSPRASEQPAGRPLSASRLARLTPRVCTGPWTPQSRPREGLRRGVWLWVTPSRPRAPIEWTGRTRRGGLRFWCMGRSWEQVTTFDLRESRRGPPCSVGCCPVRGPLASFTLLGARAPCVCVSAPQTALGDESALVVHRVRDMPGPGLRSGSWCGLQSRPADSGRELLRAMPLREGS